MNVQQMPVASDCSTLLAKSTDQRTYRGRPFPANRGLHRFRRMPQDEVRMLFYRIKFPQSISVNMAKSATFCL